MKQEGPGVRPLRTCKRTPLSFQRSSKRTNRPRTPVQALLGLPDIRVEIQFTAAIATKP